MPTTVNCPICKKLVTWEPQSSFKPFCSERCKMIDLGDWADEKHAIPVKAPIDPEMFDDMGYDEGDFFKQD
ncbi:DNA gyrase inhibitor YacG [Shewanella intestini]|uniref:DNA gyrase inhibitor YacG n=1 Tax=Shewanella intestini TaxID=2017544 RepID=A0ABS5I543_9GAMM|nr:MULTISPECIES: DNA gyrase inhibitor YacG [Shewanella]MBR9729131.1 DNA gyrase inhibitor YacG [Shewanella intestini]MRG37207.1 DNA gyrase inhibitor YacG [Shewanella sp. XMDDZSB0408]